MRPCKNWSRYSRTRAKAKVCQHVDKNWQIFDNNRTWRCATPNKPAETEAGFLSAAKWAYVSSASKNSSRTLRGDRKLASSLHFLRRISLSSYSSRKDRTRIETSRNVKWFWLSQLRLRRCPVNFVFPWSEPDVGGKGSSSSVQDSRGTSGVRSPSVIHSPSWPMRGGVVRSDQTNLTFSDNVGI